jgi:hypothetical protein
MENEMTESADLTQYDQGQKQFRKMYIGCKTCLPVAKISMEADRVSLCEYINELIFR